MGRPAKIRGTVRLLRHTMWKCGRVERAIIRFLRGRGAVSIQELRRYFRYPKIS